MHRTIVAKQFQSHLRTLKSANLRSFHQTSRCLVTAQELFPQKTNFASRHIGPRKTDVVSMLDLVGFKVRDCEIRRCSN